MPPSTFLGAGARNAIIATLFVKAPREQCLLLRCIPAGVASVFKRAHRCRYFQSTGIKQLFQDVSLQLSDRRRIALIGSNGVGKTTLIEIMRNRIPTKGLLTGQQQVLPATCLKPCRMSWLERRLATLEGASHITDLEERLSELQERLSRVEGPAQASTEGVRRPSKPLRTFRGYGRVRSSRVLAGLSSTQKRWLMLKTFRRVENASGARVCC